MSIPLATMEVRRWLTLDMKNKAMPTADMVSSRHEASGALIHPTPVLHSHVTELWRPGRHLELKLEVDSCMSDCEKIFIKPQGLVLPKTESRTASSHSSSSSSSSSVFLFLFLLPPPPFNETPANHIQGQKRSTWPTERLGHIWSSKLKGGS